MQQERHSYPDFRFAGLRRGIEMNKGTENTVGESATGSRVRGDAAGERTIGSRIRKLRIRTGMTQMQLSEELHIANKARLSNYENDRREVPLEVVIMMAEYFGTSTDYILRGIPNREEDTCLQEAVELLAAMDPRRRRAALEHLRIVEKYGM